MLAETVKQAMATTKKIETEVQKDRAEIVVKGVDAQLKEAQRIKTLAEAEEKDIDNDATQSGVMELMERIGNRGNG